MRAFYFCEIFFVRFDPNSAILLAAQIEFIGSSKLGTLTLRDGFWHRFMFNSTRFTIGIHIFIY